VNTAFAVLLVAAAAGGYAFDLWRRPYGRCWRCRGTGRVGGSTSKRWGKCPACHDKAGNPLPPRRRTGAQLVRPALRRRK
jgi:hypothetical protein